MNFALVYLAHRPFYRLVDFFHHWYVDGPRYFAHGFISFLERLDQTLAIRITFRYLFQPLYKDYTIIGRILGFIFRSIRIAIGLAVYLFFSIVFIVFYLAWVSVPPVILFLAYGARFN